MTVLTSRDMRALRYALNDAIDWQDSFADANHRKGPVAEKAAAKVRRYERLHRKLFGVPSSFARNQEWEKTAKRVSIHELTERTEK